MEFESVVHGVAHWYAARCWWADLNDLKQEAWVAVLDAQQRGTYRPARGSKAAYYQRVAVFCLKEYLWRQSSPVTGRRGHGKKMAGMHRAPIGALHAHEAAVAAEMEAIEQWWAGMSEAVRQLVRNGNGGDIAARVLLAREKPADIATELRCPVHRVWRASSQARKRIKADLDLRHAMMQGAQPA